MLAPQAETLFSGWFHKPPGEQLQVQVSGRVSEDLDALLIHRACVETADAKIAEFRKVRVSAAESSDRKTASGGRSLGLAIEAEVPELNATAYSASQ